MRRTNQHASALFGYLSPDQLMPDGHLAWAIKLSVNATLECLMAVESAREAASGVLQFALGAPAYSGSHL